MAKIYDVFTFFNEIDLLKLRLEMLGPYVDKFVIIECVETFSGKPKPLYFEENKHLFKDYEDKIIHHVTYDPPTSFEDLRNRVLDPNVDELTKQICIQALTSTNVPAGELHWLKEFYQKENIRRALVGLEDDDICFVGDLDEYWDTDLDYSVIDNESIYKLRQIVYVGYFNNRSSEEWAGTTLTRYKNIKNSCLNHIRTKSKTEYIYVSDAGWHLSFMGGVNQIKYKLDSYGHQEYNNDSVTQQIENNLNGGRDVLGRNEFTFWTDEEGLPRYIKENKNKYLQFFK